MFISRQISLSSRLVYPTFPFEFPTNIYKLNIPLFVVIETFIYSVPQIRNLRASHDSLFTFNRCYLKLYYSSFFKSFKFVTFLPSLSSLTFLTWFLHNLSLSNSLIAIVIVTFLKCKSDHITVLPVLLQRTPSLLRSNLIFQYDLQTLYYLVPSHLSCLVFQCSANFSIMQSTNIKML